MERSNKNTFKKCKNYIKWYDLEIKTVLVVLFLLLSNFALSSPILERRAIYFSSHYNEKSFRKADKILSKLINRYNKRKHYYLMVKNLFNWVEYSEKTRKGWKLALLKRSNYYLYHYSKKYPNDKYLIILKSWYLGLIGKRLSSIRMLKSNHEKIKKIPFYYYLLWKFNSSRKNPYDANVLKAIKMNRRFFKAIFDRARMLFNFGIMHEAKQLAQYSLKLKPYSPWVLTFYGVCLLEDNLPRQASYYFKRALRIEKFTPAIFELGRSFYLYGKLDKSIKYFIKSLDIKPNHIGSHYYLGKVYMIKGKKTKAVYHFSRYLALNSNSIDREDILKWMKRLLKS